MDGLSNLTKEQLLSILGNGGATKKPRKKQVLDDEKKEKMLLKLAEMREIAKTNRENKKKLQNESAKPDEIPIQQVDIFEKKYGSVFEKMTDILTDLNNNTKDVLKLKKEKISKKQSEPEPKPEPKLEVKPESINEPKPVSLSITETPTIENGGMVAKFDQGNYVGLEQSKIASIKQVNQIQMVQQQSISNPSQPLAIQSFAKKLTPMPNRDMFSKNKYQKF